MRVLVLGGTRFLGPPTVRWLLDAGHETFLFHRGSATPAACAEATHIRGDFATFADSLPELIDLRPDVVLDTVPYMEKAGHGVLHFAGYADRAVVVTSLDVYRAFAVARGSENGNIQPTPLTEDSSLRGGPAPDLTPDIDFDNIVVEQALRDHSELPVTVLRLPMIYGPNDEQHRLYDYVRRMDDGRDAIILDEARARLRWSRGYVDNVAAAVGLGIVDSRSVGRVFNVAAKDTPTETEWVRYIGDACGWSGEIVVVATELLPLALRSPLAARQDLIVSSARIRSELGYAEPVPFAQGLERTVAWTRDHPRTSERPD